MKIYVVNCRAWDDERSFNEIPDKEIEEMYEAGNDDVDMYESAEELAYNWNNEEVFYPSNSYMRVIA